MLSLSFHRRLAALVLGAALFGASSSAFAASPYMPQVSTQRGCYETGQTPIFQVGESVSIFFRVGSVTETKANVALFDFLPDGRVGAYSFGQLPTNTGFVFRARIGPPTGVEQLVLKASGTGLETARRSCSFSVVAAGTPLPTNSPPPTRTPTLTRTPRNTPTVTPTGGSDLTGSIRTNRGCREDGDEATFAIGEAIFLSFRVNSANFAFTADSLADILANGQVRLFSFGTLPTNTGFVFRAGVGPPTGTEAVELRARPPGGSTQTLDHCTFLVVGSLPATATRTHTTRTPTRTRTPMPATATSTSTPTPTPTP